MSYEAGMVNLDDRDTMRDTFRRQDADEVLDEEQLTLAEDDERLPWLEADDDDDVPPVNLAFVIGVALVGLLGISIILGGVWWWTSADDDDVLVADGSIIEAPDAPFKSRPDDRGGTAVVGTGDLSFAQGEGEARESQIASAPLPAPGFSTTAEADEADGTGEPAGTAAGASAAAVSGIGVQVGAYSSRAQAQTGWATLQQRHAVLANVNQRILQAQVDGATIYRLQAVAGDADAARALCDAIKAGGGDCQVKN